MMGDCPTCGRPTVQAMDPRCPVCIHKGREWDDEEDEQKDDTDQGSLAAFAGGVDG